MGLFKRKDKQDKGKPSSVPELGKPSTKAVTRVSGDGKRPPDAYDLEAIKAFAEEHHIDLTPILEAKQEGRKISPEAVIHIINYVLHPEGRGWDERQPGLTDLNIIQCHLFPVSIVFESMGKPDYVVGSALEIYRKGVYVHRLSRLHWFIIQLLTLAGIQAEEEELTKDIHASGFK